MKKLFITLVVLLVLIGGIALVALSQLNTIAKRGVETKGPLALKVPVEIQSVDISPFSGTVSLKGLSLGQPAGFGDGSMAALGAFDMKVEPRSLLTDHIIIDTITLDEPLLDVRMTDRGKTNFKSFQDGLGLPETADSGPSPITLTIRRLTVKAPRLSVHNDAMVSVDEDVKLADFTLTDIGTDEQGLSPREVARHVMDALQPQIAKALVAAGASDKIQELNEKMRGKLEGKLGDVLGKLKEKQQSDDQPNN